jgi:hypothetical protein
MLFVIGRYNILGWHRAEDDDARAVSFRPPEQVRLTPAQRATAWYSLVVARYFIPPDRRSERAMALSFWSLNGGLAWMLVANLVPIGIIQLYDSFNRGYWHARAGILSAAAHPNLRMAPPAGGSAIHRGGHPAGSVSRPADVHRTDALQCAADRGDRGGVHRGGRGSRIASRPRRETGQCGPPSPSPTACS